jgi:hypothetical protein
MVRTGIAAFRFLPAWLLFVSDLFDYSSGNYVCISNSRFENALQEPEGLTRVRREPKLATVGVKVTKNRRKLER